MAKKDHKVATWNMLGQKTGDSWATAEEARKAEDLTFVDDEDVPFDDRVSITRVTPPRR
ncbi:hypothetical protein [Amycolatopsis sp. DSM 110486]|uniref:hypothetical protein n=1 Tax=Amycolatopsis sp. DSM 110486 TaxID=2865832 RepID=UPI001C69AF1E|nr:hypothetical protein [Amycolatopsis sp. DSM 110486]QYN17526.1 hypothetical protein K1T34_32590 [Amycolatopsis sp. DSM 110486]